MQRGVQCGIAGVCSINVHLLMFQFILCVGEKRLFAVNHFVAAKRRETFKEQDLGEVENVGKALRLTSPPRRGSGRKGVAAAAAASSGGERDASSGVSLCGSLDRKWNGDNPEGT